MSIINNKKYLTECENYYLKPGYIFVSVQPTIITTVLGSCVAVCLYDKKKKYGGMNHFVMPTVGDKPEKTSFYGDASVIALYRTFVEFGSNSEDLTAQIVGGAFMENNDQSKLIAKGNVNVGRAMLKKLNIPVLSEDTGGTIGRKIVYSTEYNELLIAKTQVREDDFFSKI